MNRWGCLGLFAGTVIGLLIIALLIAIARATPTSSATPAAGLAPDVTIFLAESTLSRMAAEKLGRPALVDFEPGGLMMVTTRTQTAGFEPVVTVGLVLDLQGATMASRLQWVKLGFLTIPANWLPAETRMIAATVGETIQAQIPPDFALVGFETTPNGINFLLKWIGR